MRKKDLEKIWNSIQSHLESTMISAAYQAWIAPVKVINIDRENKILFLSTEVDMGKSILENRYKQTLENSVAEILGEPYKITVMLADEMDGIQEEANYTPYTDELNLNPKYIFSTFVVGKNNEFAHAVSLAVANNPSNAQTQL